MRGYVDCSSSSEPSSKKSGQEQVARPDSGGARKRRDQMEHVRLVVERSGPAGPSSAAPAAAIRETHKHYLEYTEPQSLTASALEVVPRENHAVAGGIVHATLNYVQRVCGACLSVDRGGLWVIE